MTDRPTAPPTDNPEVLSAVINPRADLHESFRFVDETSGNTIRALRISEDLASPDYVDVEAACYDPEGLFVDIESLRFRRHPIRVTQKVTAEKLDRLPRAAKIGAAVTAVTFSVALGSLWIKYRKKA